MTLQTDLTPLDLFALATFLLGWAAYEIFASRRARRGETLGARMTRWRETWSETLLQRDNRIMDVQILRSLVGNSSFLASTAIFVIGGLVAVIGASSEVVAAFNQFDYLAATTADRFGLQVSLLIIIFINAFFRLAWSMRLHNNAAVVLGTIPQPESGPPEVARERARTMAALVSLAANHYNGGMHAYYFGLGAVAWFVHPLALTLSTLLVIATLYRREFLSRANRALLRE